MKCRTDGIAASGKVADRYSFCNDIVFPSDPSGDIESDCSTTKNLDCIKFLVKNADSLCSSNLFASTIDCLLDPVYSRVSKKCGTALDCNPMPGGTIGSAGGRMSPGRSSASCSLEISCETSPPEGEEYGDHSSTLKNYQYSNYTSACDRGMKESLVTCGGTKTLCADESCPFFNRVFPNVNVGYCGYDGKPSDLSVSDGAPESVAESLTPKSKYFIFDSNSNSRSFHIESYLVCSLQSSLISL